MTPEQIQALKSKLAQMDEADVDQEADESVFEDEDIVTDTSADGKKCFRWRITDSGYKNRS